MSFGASHLAYTFFYWVDTGQCTVPRPGDGILKHTVATASLPQHINEAILSVRLSLHPEYIAILKRFFYQAQRIGVSWIVTEQSCIFHRKKFSFLGLTSQDPLCVLRVYGCGPREHVETAVEYSLRPPEDKAPVVVSLAPGCESPTKTKTTVVPARRPSARVRSTSVLRTPRGGAGTEAPAPPRVPRLSLEQFETVSLSDDDDAIASNATSSDSSSGDSSHEGSSVSSDVLITRDAPNLAWVQRDLLVLSESQSELTGRDETSESSAPPTPSSSSSSSAASSVSLLSYLLEASEVSEEISDASPPPTPRSVPRFAWLDGVVSGEEDEDEEDEEIKELTSPRRREHQRRATTNAPSDLRRFVVISQARRSSTTSLSRSPQVQRRNDG